MIRSTDDLLAAIKALKLMLLRWRAGRPWPWPGNGLVVGERDEALLNVAHD